jgi:hypothetical protein
MERAVVILLGFFLALVLIEEMAVHLWLALILAAVAGVVGRHLRRNGV